MTKLSDYVIDFIYRQGVHDIFTLSGGGCMHLIDSLGSHGKIKYVCNLHEQACAMAMEGYARDRGDVGVALVTTGPGSTNTLTGVIGAWLDSVPSVVVSGQVKRETMRPFPELRQLGDQEINIIDMVKPVTKYAAVVDNPQDIRYHLEKAFYLARHGRPGPCWIDIPLDVQSSQIEPDKLRGFDRSEMKENADMARLDKQVQDTASRLAKAKRPVLLIGKGIRIAHAQEKLLELVQKLKVPVITSFTGFDLIEANNPYYQGRQGTLGPRGGNFIVQNSDLLLCIGTRLNTRMVSYNYKMFARAAYKIVVDIDEAELRKPTIHPDMPVVADAAVFIQKLLDKVGSGGLAEKKEWMQYCMKINAKYPVVRPEHYKEKDYVNLYAFVKELSNAMKENETVVCTDGFACIGPYQAFDIKSGQRVIFNSGCASMGYDLPAAIGAAVAEGRQKQIVCLAGDGSIQLNIQELQTIVHYHLPIKIFVINNFGYLSIRETQKNLFNSHFVATDPDTGVGLPDMEKISVAYGLPYRRLTNNADLQKQIKEFLSIKGAAMCEVMMSPKKGLDTKGSTYQNEQGQLVSRPLEDLTPLLPRKELKENMLIDMYEGWDS